MLQRIVEALSNRPRLFLFCRGVLEGNFASIRRLIRDELPVSPEERVLDVACGPGAFSTLFPPEGYVGVDLNDGYIRYARRHYRGTFHVMDARRLDFPPASFDGALVFGLLHHLDDEDASSVLVALRRVLRPGGRALVIEDIPTESRLNLVGHLLHRIENGHFIRPAEDYRRLLSRSFTIDDERVFRSGICDYYAARVRRDATERSTDAR